MTFYKHYYRLIIVVLFIVGIISCGKVTQTVSTDKDSLSFNLTFTVPTVTAIQLNNIPEDATATPSVQHGLDFNSDIYVAVIGISDMGIKKELSWGRGSINKKKIKLTYRSHSNLSDSMVVLTPSSPINTAQSTETPSESVQYSSVAYNKKRIKIKSSDHTWSKPELNVAEMVWNVKSNKIEKDFSRYLISAYSNASIYRLSFVDYDTVSTNSQLTLSHISTYDTFIAILEIIYMEDSENGFSFNHEDHYILTQLFDEPFYNALQFNFPNNISAAFKEKSPSFQFKKTPLIKELLTFFDLANGDKDNALVYLDTMSPDLMSESLKEILRLNLNMLFPDLKKLDNELKEEK